MRHNLEASQRQDHGKDDAYGHWLGTVPAGLLLSLGQLLISTRRKQRA